LFNGAFNTVGDEGERPSFLDPFWRGSMGHNNDWYVQGMFAPPSTSAPIC
jgi:hypothetical protein